MSEANTNKFRFQNLNLLGGAIIAVAIVLGAVVIAGAYKYKFKKIQTIRVTGSAQGKRI